MDQYLEHLIELGITKIIRVGGQSKSKVLAPHNIHALKSSESATKAEKYLAHQAYNKLDEHKSNAQSILAALHGLHKNRQWANLKAHLAEEHPQIHRQFKGVDEEGFRTVGRHPFDIWCASDASGSVQKPANELFQPLMGIEAIARRANRSVHSLTYHERKKLIDHWVEEVHRDQVAELFEIVDGATSTRKQLNDIHSETSRRLLQEADVIGITTSGLAGQISLLKHVACKVLICEEAGEIMEPHMISALLPTIQHCIQIGDHEQLRPSVSNYDELSLESDKGKLHQLDKSQFERLSVGESHRPLMPVAQLNVQRRMRPEVSTLIRETIYEKLVDHPATKILPDVVGLRKNIFWFDHDNPEDAQEIDIQHSKSKSNKWEVSMVQALVRHVVRQGTYKSSDIAVLTPYTGQLQKLRTAMRKDFEIVLSDRDEEALDRDGFGTERPQLVDDRVTAALEHGSRPLEKKKLTDLLRIATVDNFQGEEAKVIIVSLVRSNKKRNVGFLKTSNRINVLLSRAKHGMYLIGTSDTYSSVDMWQKVIDMLRATDSIGQTLGLCCPRHPEKDMEVREPDDFSTFSPEGGCREACSDRLECGHSCAARCHSEAMHAVFKCEQPCERQPWSCGHFCQKATCGESCGVCMVKIDDVSLPCGHVHNGVACHRTLDRASIPCDVPTPKHVPGCGHEVIVRCSQYVAEPGFKCPTPCGTILPCGHVCPGTCGRCDTKGIEDQPIVNHAKCNTRCGRKMGTCTHNCDRLCHGGDDCGVCPKPCEVRCKHSRCPRKCHETCAPCINNCAWSCEHQGDCTMPCSAPCNRLPCDERCTKLLPCGHQCPSVCGEECPVNYCQECGMEPDATPDMVMMTR